MPATEAQGKIPGSNRKNKGGQGSVTVDGQSAGTMAFQGQAHARVKECEHGVAGPVEETQGWS